MNYNESEMEKTVDFSEYTYTEGRTSGRHRRAPARDDFIDDRHALMHARAHARSEALLMFQQVVGRVRRVRLWCTAQAKAC